MRPGAYVRSPRVCDWVWRCSGRRIGFRSRGQIDGLGGEYRQGETEEQMTARDETNLWLSISIEPFCMVTLACDSEEIYDSPISCPRKDF